jgi:carbonic anhydrase
MSCSRVFGECLLALSVFCFAVFVVAPSGVCQVINPPEKVEPGQHQHAHEHHHLHLLLGEQKCAPTYTYEEGSQGPSHWPYSCTDGKMQSPIDIQSSQKLPINNLKFNYQPADLDILNDCNQYRILVKFPDNYWFMVGKKPYNLAEIHFREPGETAINGKRPPMSVEFLHFSPEGVFLVIEVPVVVGKENPVMKEILENIPEPGKEEKVSGIKINPFDLLPADRSSFYRYPGSLTTPNCTEVVSWYVMKTPIEMSEAQIAEYARHYHNTARPLQPGNGRPVADNSQH